MRVSRLSLFVLIGLVVLAGAAEAQTPTGTLTGRVSSEVGPLAGVAVTASSASLQGGSRTANTTVSGDYLFHFLAPGDYEVVFELDQFGTQKHQVKVSVAQSAVVDARLMPEVTDVLVVTAARELISAKAVGATTFVASEIDKLAVGRDIESAVLLAPGTTARTVSGNPSISGAPGHDSLYLIDGVDNRETERGGPLDLYIEDALEETTVLTSGISAEYGRFAGGVVNVITKSGGNQFSGSLRVSLENEEWSSDTPLTTGKNDEINSRYEATFGGRLIRDKLWFFLAARDRGLSSTGQMVDPGLTNYGSTDDEQRFEVKLTASPHISHQIVYTHLEYERELTNVSPGFPVVEFDALMPFGRTEMDLDVLRYTGVLGPSFFIEAQYAERNTVESGFGSLEDPDDLAAASPILHATGQLGNTSLSCGSCEDATTDQQSLLLKASWFASTQRFGSHDIVLGYEDHNDARLKNLRNSPTGFFLYPQVPPAFDADGLYTPVLPAFATYIVWNPIFLLSPGTDHRTQSVFINDTWRLNSRLTFNLGARFDKNKADNGVGIIADDDRISPRLGMTWDLKGDGEWLVNASLGRYSSFINQNVPGLFSGPGSLSQFLYLFFGPTVVGLPAEQAAQQVFDGFNAMGGVGNLTYPHFLGGSLAGATIVFENLATPVSDEITVGFTKRLGSRGLVRVDYVHREYKDFYAEKLDATTGTTTITFEVEPGVEISGEFDRSFVINDSDILTRDYDGVHTQFQYTLDRWRFAGNYTWSHLRGNFAGEAYYQNAGPAMNRSVFQYPEYRREEWSYPTGDLAGDSRHKLRAWMIWDAVSSRRHNLSLSLLQSFRSGSPYGAGADINIDPTWAGDFGYLTPPSALGYWFTERDAFRTDDLVSTDISFNYSFLIPTGNTDIELFIQPEVLNVFNQDAVVNPNTGVATLAPFNPYTETPVEGVNWQRVDGFGDAQNAGDFQRPRTFRVSLGIRF